MTKTGSKILSLLGLLLSLGLLFWTLHGLSLSELLTAANSASAPLLVLAAIIIVAAIYLRAIRWRLILNASRDEAPIHMLWQSTIIGLALNNLLPARLGEVGRAVVLHKTTKIPTARALASLILDRLVDGIAILALLFAAMLAPGFPPDTTIMGQPVWQWASILGLILLGGIFASFILATLPHLVANKLDRFTKISEDRKKRLKTQLISFTEGLSAIKSPGRFIKIILWGLAYWLMDTFAMWLAFKAFAINAPFSAAMFLQGVTTFASAIPSSPGYFGIFEKLAVVSLGVYGVPRLLATSWGFIFHLIHYIPITLLGLFYFWRLPVRLKDLDQQPVTNPAKRPPVLAEGPLT